MNLHEKGMAGRMAEAFIDSKLTPLIIVASILIGFGAVALLPIGSTEAHGPHRRLCLEQRSPATRAWFPCRCSRPWG